MLVNTSDARPLDFFAVLVILNSHFKSQEPEFWMEFGKSLKGLGNKLTTKICEECFLAGNKDSEQNLRIK